MNLDEVTFTGCRSPQTMTKSFSPNPILAGGTSTLTFTMANTSGSSYTGVHFNDPLPDGLTVASNATVSQCGGSVSALTGATSIGFSGGTINANSTCPVSVSVTGTAIGEYKNVSGFITSTEGGTNTTTNGSGSATLSIVKPPTFTKKFTTNPIYSGGTTTLKFLLTNPNTVALGLASPAFTDTMPVGLTIAAGPVTSNTCGGTLTAAPTTRVISLSGGSISASSSCEIAVDVTSSSVANYPNDAGQLSTSVAGLTSTAGTAVDTLAVIAHYPGIKFSKLVASSPSGPWTSFTKITPVTGTVYYRMTVENVGDVDLTNVSISDPTVSLAGCSLLTTPFTLTTANPTASCDVGPFPAGTGSFQNTAGARGSYGGTTYTSSSTAEYLGVVTAPAGTPAMSLVKQVGTSATGPWTSTLTTSGNVYYKFVVTNTGTSTGSLSGISVVDPTVSTASCEWIDPLPEGSSTVCVVGPFAPSPGTISNTAHAASTSPAVISSDSSATYTNGSHTVSGVVWFDDNDDGLTADETGLFNVSVGLYQDTNSNGSYDTGTDVLLSSKFTDSAGAYSFSGLPDGNYIVRVISGVSGYSLVSGGTNPRILTGLTGDSSGVNFGYDTAAPPTTIDLTLAKTNSTGGASTTDLAFTWTLTATNNGTGAASFTSGQRILTDTLPLGATYDTLSPNTSDITGDLACTLSGTSPDVLDCNADGPVSIDPGKSFSMTFTAHPTSSGSLINTASVDPDALITESDETNNGSSDTVTITDPPTPTPTFTATTVVASPDLVLVKTDSTGAAGTVGVDFTWTLTATNSGSGAAAFTNGQRILTDALPAGADYSGVSVDTSGMTGSVACGIAGGPPGTLDCSANGDLSIGASQSFNVSFTVHPTVDGSMDNTASVDPDGLVAESNEGNNGGSSSVAIAAVPTFTPTPTETFTPTFTFTPTSTSVTGTIDLVLAKTDSTGGAGAVGTDFTWTLTISNNGSLPADFSSGQRLLTDPLPGGADYSGMSIDASGLSGSSVTCGVTGSTLDCNADGAVTIAGGESFTVSFTANPNTDGNLDNTASVDPDNAVIESNETNNDGSNTVVIAALPTSTPTFTTVPTSTPTFTTIPTSTPTFTATFTSVPTNTPTYTATATNVSAPTSTPSFTPTATNIPVVIATQTPHPHPLRPRPAFPERQLQAFRHPCRLGPPHQPPLRLPWRVQPSHQRLLRRPLRPCNPN